MGKREVPVSLDSTAVIGEVREGCGSSPFQGVASRFVTDTVDFASETERDGTPARVKTTDPVLLYWSRS